MDLFLQFSGAVNYIRSIPENKVRSLYTAFRLKQIRKGQCLVREGERSQDIGFVVSGLFRSYYLGNDGDELTKGFFTENRFVSAYSALLENRESHFTIE